MYLFIENYFIINLIIFKNFFCFILINTKRYTCYFFICPCRYILFCDVDILLNCNLFEVYTITKWADTYLHGLSYIGLSSKGNYLRKSILEKFSSIICMSERQRWILSKAVQQGQFSLYGSAVTTSIFLQRALHTSVIKKTRVIILKCFFFFFFFFISIFKTNKIYIYIYIYIKHFHLIMKIF